jgi:malonyl-CoA reductase/3-hydroxypropionate dehydrogenase (NADP+)
MYPSVPAANTLAGKVILVTGAAGNIGGAIAAHCLSAGARVVMTGRDPARLAAARDGLLAATGAAPEAAVPAILEGGDPDSVRAAVARALDACGRLDVLVNNAGSAGPRQPLAAVPFDAAELGALRAAGATDTETAGAAARSLLGVAWNVVRAAAPSLQPGASVIHVSTIFSRTPYYGRAAYTVPKAALNAFSALLARELGPRGIRVNTVYPGPIESERIHAVFAAMDALRGGAAGTTAAHFLGTMSLARAGEGESPRPRYPQVADVVAAVAFLASDASAALNGQGLEVTHGMAVPDASPAVLLAPPELTGDALAGQRVLVAGGTPVADAVAMAQAVARSGARVLLGLPDAAAVSMAAQLLAGLPGADQIAPLRVDRRRPATIASALAGSPLSAAVLLPAGVRGTSRGLATATDADVAALLDDELVGAMALARELSRHWQSRPPAGGTPRVVFLGGGDGEADAFAPLRDAGVAQLIRVWREEAATPREGDPLPLQAHLLLRSGAGGPADLDLAARHVVALLGTGQAIEQIALAL